MATTLFTLPITTGGTITATSPASSTFLITFSSPPDNRVTIPFLRTLHLALDILAERHPKGVLIITSGLQKFFSNGFDVEHLNANPDLITDALLPVLRRLYSYPGPTVCLFNGHTFGAGVFLGMASDYRLMNGSKGFWCLPEVDLGMVIPAPIIPLLRRYITDASVWKRAIMEGARFSGKEALAAGIVDGLGGVEEALKLVEERKLTAKVLPGAWSGLRMASAVEIGEVYVKEGENVSLRDGTARIQQWEKEERGKL